MLDDVAIFKYFHNELSVFEYPVKSQTDFNLKL